MSEPFHLQPSLDQLYKESAQKFAFQGETPQALEEWQAQFQDALSQLLGLNGRISLQIPHAQKLHSTDKGAYFEEKYALDVGDSLAPLYLLIPKTEPPYMPVLAFHGHGSGVQLILGNDLDEIQTREKRASDDNYAQLLAEEGYFVGALEQRGFGERVTAQVNENSQNSCRHLAFEYMLNGRSLLGERLRDAMLAINFLQQRGDIIFDSLASVGFSGGGTTAMFLSALDDRIQSTIVASYFCSFKQSILGVPHCECNYVPGILELAEMGEIAALIAPRNLSILTGENDPIFPIAGVCEQIKTVERAYQVMNAEESCTLIVHDGAHTFRHDLASEWLKNTLT